MGVQSLLDVFVLAAKLRYQKLNDFLLLGLQHVVHLFLLATHAGSQINGGLFLLLVGVFDKILVLVKIRTEPVVFPLCVYNLQLKQLNQSQRQRMML